VYGEEFEKLYIEYEEKGMYRRRVPAKDLWFHIEEQQIETGMPYMLYKDQVNRKTNQSNLGVIQSSNLCTEVVEYTDEYETAVCTLSSICLPRFVEKQDGEMVFNYEKLRHIAGIVTRNLNKVIDVNLYPVDKAKTSNFKHRPIGIGIQGLADVYCMMDLPYDSPEARLVNRRIAETIYFGALTMSNELAIKHGPYETFHYNGGCPFSKGKLQWHMWGLTQDDLLMDYDWEYLIQSVIQYGTRNSLLTTVMPTASTSQIMGNTESYEAPISNVCTRTTLAGEFTVINKYLVEKLIDLGLWNKKVQNELLYDKGSVQNIKSIPDDIKKIYKTAFELQNKPIITQSIERGPFIDQSQSLNLFCAVPDFDKMTSAHFFGWRGGLKTGMYYLKTQPAVDPISFGLDIDIINEIEKERGIDKKAKITKKIGKKNVEKVAQKPKSAINCESCSS
jgi:ribonucleoside-diphosphate reductase alpha subunit